MRTTKSDIGNVIRAGEPRFADIDLEQFTESEMRKVAHNFGVDLSTLSTPAPGATGTPIPPAAPAGTGGAPSMTTGTTGPDFPPITTGSRLTKVRSDLLMAGFTVMEAEREVSSVKKGRVIRVERGTSPQVAVPVISAGTPREGDSPAMQFLRGVGQTLSRR